MRLTITLPNDDPEMVDLMRKWLRHIEKTGELNVHIRSLYEREIECQTDAETAQWRKEGGEE